MFARYRPFRSIRPPSIGGSRKRSATDRIRVNSVHLGFVRTPIVAHAERTEVWGEDGIDAARPTVARSGHARVRRHSSSSSLAERVSPGASDDSCSTSGLATALSEALSGSFSLVLLL